MQQYMFMLAKLTKSIILLVMYEI